MKRKQQTLQRIYCVFICCFKSCGSRWDYWRCFTFVGVRSPIQKVKHHKAVYDCLQTFGMPDEFMYVGEKRRNVNNIYNEEAKKERRCPPVILIPQEHQNKYLPFLVNVSASNSTKIDIQSYSHRLFLHIQTIDKFQIDIRSYSQDTLVREENLNEHKFYL